MQVFQKEMKEGPMVIMYVKVAAKSIHICCQMIFFAEIGASGLSFNTPNNIHKKISRF